MSLSAPPLGLYVHIPWCIKKCPYCDFNSHASIGEIPEHRYAQALLRDLRQDLPRIEKRRVDSIFFGGGTPSLFNPDTIHSLIEAIRDLLSCSKTVEITLEANPGTVETEKFKGFKQAGVNRLSIGIQSFADKHLQALGRVHNGNEAILAAESAHTAGLDNFNLDLMFGLPEQTLQQAADDMRQAIALEPAHISSYQLTIEKHTLFFQSPPVLPEHDAIWQMQCEQQKLLDRYGYRRYEVSAYSKPGLRCHHNLNYWTFGDYLGIGAGAHSKITDDQSGTIQRLAKVRHPKQYMQSAGDNASIASSRCIAGQELGLEFLMNGLRLCDGFEKLTFNQRTGMELSELEPALTQCLDENLLQENGNCIRCSDFGQHFLDEILTRFAPG